MTLPRAFDGQRSVAPPTTLPAVSGRERDQPAGPVEIILGATRCNRISTAFSVEENSGMSLSFDPTGTRRQRFASGQTD
jgi:hypothetical protein